MIANDGGKPATVRALRMVARGSLLSNCFSILANRRAAISEFPPN